jgi:hypothetical protein
MRHAPVRIALAVVGVSSLLAPAAAAAPTSFKPPRITGRAVYLSTLTCHRGSLSRDAVSYSYRWEAGGTTVGTKPTLRIPEAAIGYTVVCTVTARDARGGRTAATAGGVSPVAATPRLKIASARVSGHAITLTGVVSPEQAVSRRGGLTLERRDAIGITHLTPTPIRPKPDGHFTVRVTDTTAQGRETYVLLYQAHLAGFVAQVQAKRVLTLR